MLLVFSLKQSLTSLPIIFIVILRKGLEYPCLASHSSVAEDDLELLNLLPLFPKCWDDRQALSFILNI